MLRPTNLVKLFWALILVLYVGFIFEQAKAQEIMDIPSGYNFVVPNNVPAYVGISCVDIESIMKIHQIVVDVSQDFTMDVPLEMRETCFKLPIPVQSAEVTPKFLSNKSRPLSLRLY